MNIQGWFPLGLTGLISLMFKRLSRVFSSPTVQKHQFFGTLPSLWSSSYICTWPLENHNFDYMGLCWQCDLFFFLYCLVCHSFSSKEPVSFHFMAAVSSGKEIKKERKFYYEISSWVTRWALIHFKRNCKAWRDWCMETGDDIAQIHG